MPIFGSIVEVVAPQRKIPENLTLSAPSDSMLSDGGGEQIAEKGKAMNLKCNCCGRRDVGDEPGAPCRACDMGVLETVSPVLILRDKSDECDNAKPQPSEKPVRPLKAYMANMAYTVASLGMLGLIWLMLHTLH